MGCSRGRLNRSFVTGTCLHLPSYASIISRLLISLRAPVRGSAGQPVRRPPSPPVHRSACPSMSVAGPHPPRAGPPRCMKCPPGGRGHLAAAKSRRTGPFAPPGSLGPSGWSAAAWTSWATSAPGSRCAGARASWTRGRVSPQSRHSATATARAALRPATGAGL